MPSSDYVLNSDIVAIDEAAALVVDPNPTTATNETPAPDEARPPSTIADLNPVPNTNTPLKSAAIFATLLEFGFNFASGETSLPVDEQTGHLPIDDHRRTPSR